MKKAVFFDIDGTLWDERMQVPKSTVTAIRKLREGGNYAFICSGRSRATIQAKELLEEIGFDGILAGCGTYIEYLNQVIYDRILTKEELLETLTVLKQYHMPAVLEGTKYLYADEEAFGEDPYISYLKSVVGENFLPMDGKTDGYKANKISADFTRGDVCAVKSKLEEKYELIFHEMKIVEVLPKGFSKASGIGKICEYLKIAHEDTYAFGDSANDLEMLAYVKHGIAMGNATDVVKNTADYVTASVKEDGIMKGLKHFDLI